MKDPVLVVDGYNIIGAWEELRALREKDLGSARDQLASLLAAFCPWSWERIIVVFDGQHFGWENRDGVEVVFTGAGETADTMIEKLSAGLSPGCRVEVATSDFAEYRAASNLGAAVMSAPALKERLKEQSDLCRDRQQVSAGRGIMLNDRVNKRVLESLERLRRL